MSKTSPIADTDDDRFALRAVDSSLGAAGMTRAFSSCRTSAILASDTSRSYTGCRSSTCSSNAPRISAAASLLAREAWPRTNLIYRRCRRGMAAICVRRAKAALSTGCEPHPAPAPSGSKTGCTSSRARSLCTPKNAVSTGPWRLMITALALSAMAIRHDGLTHKQNTEPLQTC